MIKQGRFTEDISASRNRDVPQAVIDEASTDSFIVADVDVRALERAEQAE